MSAPRAVPPARSGGFAALPEIEHRYGERVHILQNGWLLTALARLSSPDVRHPELGAILRSIYSYLVISAVGRELPLLATESATRMVEQHPNEGYYRGPVIDPATEIVIADIVRAGIVPSQVCFDLLSSVLPDPNVRLDHLHMARVSDADGHVVGVDLAGSKIGGSVAGKTLILPDPMGATGATTKRAVRHYLEHHGHPARIIAMPMIVTPEYLLAVTEAFGDMVVYSLRLDRGLSAPEVLRTVPGERWSEERGLNEKGYIVPGAGGLGEVLNNSWC